MPTDEDFFTRMQNLKKFVGNDNFPTWIGLEDFGNIGGNGITTRFTSVVDNTPPAFTSGVAGVFPWFADNPDDDENNQNCVSMLNIDALIDQDCSALNTEFMCQATCTAPTVSPTSSPAKQPSKAPSTSPIKEPTTSPVKGPTSNPIKTPTDSPSISPTQNPLNIQTDSPTASPTTSPGTPQLPTSAENTSNLTVLNLADSVGSGVVFILLVCVVGLLIKKENEKSVIQVTCKI